MSGEQPASFGANPEDARRFERRLKTANTIVELLGVRGPAGDLDAEWYDPASNYQLLLRRRIDPRAHKHARYRYLFQYRLVSDAQTDPHESVILLDEKSVVMKPLSGPIAQQCQQFEFDAVQAKLWDIVDDFFTTAPIPAIDSLPEPKSEEES